MNQIEAHKKIDILFLSTPNSQNISNISALMSTNLDAKNYFFYQANELWLDWLWENGFLDVIKQKSEDPSQYSYQTPELNYLVRMAEKVPDKVANIIFVVPISKETFNPEVVDQFLRICTVLPAKQLAKIVPKIVEERWIPLLGSFIRWGFDIEKMFMTLSEDKNCKSILILTEAVLSIKSKEELKEADRYINDDPFCLRDLSETKVFDYLINIPDDFAVESLKLTTEIMRQVVCLGGENKEDKVFTSQDFDPLYEVDFFSLKFISADNSYRSDIRSLAAVVVNLASRIFAGSNQKPESLQKIYGDTIAKLPDSQSMWRLKLFVLSLNPEEFREELKPKFFALFSSKEHYELILGTEYAKALQKSFSALSDDNQRNYVKKAIEYFSNLEKDKRDDERSFYLERGSLILSVIKGYLTTEEKTQAKTAGFKFEQGYQPKPIIGHVTGGSVSARGPISQEEFDKLSLAEVIKRLKNEWQPEKLKELYKDDNFLNPRNAEGAGDLLKTGVPKRLQGFVDNAGSFFDRGKIDQHYTYSFLRGVQEAIKNDRDAAVVINWDEVIKLCESILDSNKTESFDTEKRSREQYHIWLANWDGVYSAFNDVIRELIKEEQGKIVIDFVKYRDRILEIIKLLLDYPDPSPEDEKIETAKSTTKSPGDANAFISDPFTMAINSVRGQALESFVMFVFQDGKKFDEKAEIKIDKDLKKLYENTLRKEDTRAIRFLFGHYLPTFYYRDKGMIVKLLPILFPSSTDKKYFYTATWEGYLTNNLFKEIFFDPEFQKLYFRGLEITDADYPVQQKHFKEPDEGLSIHLALAFVYFKDFGLDHPLFISFWEKNIPEQHAEFVEFVGRSFLHSGNDNNQGFLKTNPDSKQRIIDFWEWLFAHYKFKSEKPFLEFGSWIGLDKTIFEPTWLATQIRKTLEKTGGVLSWDYGLTKNIVELAENAPEETLEIARLFLLENKVRKANKQYVPHLEDEWLTALQIIYKIPDDKLKSKVYDLINDLIREGGHTFWGLEKIVKAE